jgi:hypothetical protein
MRALRRFPPPWSAEERGAKKKGGAWAARAGSPAGGLLLLAEHRIVVLGNPGDDARDAFAADAELAGIVDVDAGLVEHFEDLFAFGDEIFLAGARELPRSAAAGTDLNNCACACVNLVDQPRTCLRCLAKDGTNSKTGPPAKQEQKYLRQLSDPQALGEVPRGHTCWGE